MTLALYTSYALFIFFTTISPGAKPMIVYPISSPRSLRAQRWIRTNRGDRKDRGGIILLDQEPFGGYRSSAILR